MSVREVHWHEGMFLLPHHFQTAQRASATLTRRAAKWTDHYNWGIRAIDIDAEALANSRLVIRSLRAILRDGSSVAVPEDGLLPALDLKGILEGGKPLTVYLAVPALNLGRANVADETPDPNARYRLDTQELEDENTGVNPQPIRVRLPNFRLLVGGQDQTGYEVLAVAQLQKSALENAVPQLDASYIPPLLACDAWPVLANDILQSICDRIGRKRERLATQLAARVGNEPDPADMAVASQLRELNEAYAVLGILAIAPGVHPLWSYVELCRVVGQLSIFDLTGRWPNIPAYDHDDLAGCFYQIKLYLDALLNILPEPEYRERAFVGMGMRMQVSVEADWLDQAWALYIGVRSSLDPDEMMRLLTVPGQLDMKVGSGDRVDTIYQLGQAGLRFEPCPRPKILPDLPGQRYFRVSRQPEREWLQAQRALTFAIRLNETRIVGAIQGQRTIAIRVGGQGSTFQFTLYAVPQGS